MIYVGRSSLSTGLGEGGASSVFKIGFHHAKIAVDIWRAETGTHIGMPMGEDLDPYHPEPVIKKGAFQCDGAIVICPPSHGKTEEASHWCARRISENPYEQGWVVHAQAKQAENILGYVSNYFDITTAQGRRNRALFPSVPYVFKKRNNRVFWLDLPHKTKQPTMSAAGVRAKVSGSDASFILFDDPVDQRETEQDAERERTYSLMQGTWLTRLRGQKGKGDKRGTFHLTTTTLWHPDDANCRRIALAKEKQDTSAFLPLLVSRQGCGGPNSVPPFKPLWPEMYGQQYLRRKYAEMRSPTLYSAAYMSDPVAEARKIIRKIRLYDPAHPDHARFLQIAKFYLSLDPAATNREGADKAGIVYGGLGELAWEEISDDGTQVMSTEMRFRVLDAHQIHATQSELVEHAFGLCLVNKVDHVVAETRSGYVAVAEMFENMHGIKPIRIDPGNKSKEIRLRSAAPMLEDGNSDSGLRAVVEFPGKRDETGKIVPDEKFHFLYDQILNFGFCSDDHCVDAVTQVVNYLASDLGVGRGIASRIAQQQVERAIDHRLRSITSKWLKSGGGDKPVQLEDAEWVASLTSG